MRRPQRVRVVGTGLLGTSVGLALCAQGVEVTLADVSPVSVALAQDMGAGRVAAADDAAPDLVVVAAPPDVVAQVVIAELERWPEAVVTDVASVKGVIVDQVIASGADVLRYVGGHPMAGRERSGAVAARSDLFEGRTWVVCAGEPSEAAEVVTATAQLCGARVVTMNPAEHDHAVAAVSHLPQIAASAVAGRLRDLSETAVGLAGQGVRDVTRIAASDPLLWTQILSGNAAAVLPLVDSLVDDLTAVRDALADVAEERESAAVRTPGPRAVLAQAIADGQDGRARIPGKHGAPPTAYGTVAVLIPDEPGALGRVFTDVGTTGVSVEDMRLEHDSAVRAGLLELDVLPVNVQNLRDVLAERGWKAHVVGSH